MTAPGFTSRRWRSWRPRRSAFVDWRSGAGVTDSGSSFDLPPAAGLGDFLHGLPVEVERVFVVGPRIGETPDGLRAWVVGETPGWWPAPAGHFLEDLSQFTLRFESGGGRAVTVHRAASWFGEGDYSPGQARAAWLLLARSIAEVFDGGALLATPATTGRDLLVRSLGERAFHVASAEDQALIRSTTGQGRDQLLPPPAGLAGHMPGLAEYDGRLMYGALCRGLGSGVQSDQLAPGPAERAAMAAEFVADPYRRARYSITFRVPAGWSHVGLVGVWEGDGWSYPSAPGVEGSAWVDGAELALLVRWRWPFVVNRRLRLHQPDGPGPLDLWSRKLVNLRLGLMAQGEALAGAGARAILLHSIGAFMGRPHVVTRTTSIDQAGAVPAGALGVRVEGDSIVWGEAQPPAWPEMAHPEWSAAIWARCRARLLHGPGDTGALHVEPGEVVAFRTDALYLTSCPDWPDDGRAGRLRLVSYLPGPVAWPRSKPELLRLRGEARTRA